MELPVSVTVNGRRYDREVEPRLLLVHFLRDTLGLTGTKIGCDTSQCGACTVLLDGVAVKSCTCLAVQADGVSGHDHRRARAATASSIALQEAFWAKHGLQCGFCTPGMIFAAHELLRTNRNPTPEQIRHGARRQHVPLHRLPEHRARGAGGGRPRGRHGDERRRLRLPHASSAPASGAARIRGS